MSLQDATTRLAAINARLQELAKELVTLRAMTDAVPQALLDEVDKLEQTIFGKPDKPDKPDTKEPKKATGKMQIFPANNMWNVTVDKLPVDPRSEGWKANIGNRSTLKADFGSGTWEGKRIGIPINYVDASTPRKKFDFLYSTESDHVEYPLGIVEEGTDRHLIAVDLEEGKLYELFHTYVEEGKADSGAVFDLNSNAMRPDSWTSADAAGLPILPGLVRYDEVAAGFIPHALRITVSKTWSNIWPATHKTDGKQNTPIPERPPLGARLRVKASLDISKFPKDVQVILRCAQTYGLIIADNGSDVFISGEPDERWNNDMLATIRKVFVSELEFVDQTPMIVKANSYEARQI
jgi:hypothetical protein